MQLQFYKYEGTGNDFVMVDNRSGFFPKANIGLIEKICDRRFGIGADGLILLELDDTVDFRMVYYNSDGRESSMCGNGGRCLVAFAHKLELIDDKTTFIATDGLHQAQILPDGRVSLQMKNVQHVQREADYTFLDTGSPHHVMLVEALENYDVKGEGARIRYSPLYGEHGSNVNFVKPLADGGFALRTYERGVEDETLSCGTGATAAAIAMHATGMTKDSTVKLRVMGGALEVKFDYSPEGYSNVWLEGPATFVFEGTIAL